MSMWKHTARQIISMIGGTRQAAARIKNMHGEPMAHPNLSNMVAGEADAPVRPWLEDALVTAGCEKMRAGSDLDQAIRMCAIRDFERGGWGSIEAYASRSSAHLLYAIQLGYIVPSTLHLDEVVSTGLFEKKLKDAQDTFYASLDPEGY